MKKLKLLTAALFVAVLSATGFAQSSKTVVGNAIASKDHTTLVAAIKAAGLVETLSGKGPFTVFAPTNKAFDKLPKGTLTMLLKPENKSKLANILTYHVVAGNLDSKAIIAAITKGKGSATLTTVQGGKLVGKIVGKDVVLTDEKGNKAKVTAVDIRSSNGVIHVIDAVVMSK
ncbi:MAG: fasciclin domain-containing protein [Flavobacterium sp.]|nr:fasciclin domain-containing protein [Flavobacterium sp.]